MCDLGDTEYALVRVKRAWVPDWLWRAFCVGNLATFTPFKQTLTRRPTDEGARFADGD